MSRAKGAAEACLPRVEDANRRRETGWIRCGCDQGLPLCVDLVLSAFARAVTGGTAPAFPGVGRASYAQACERRANGACTGVAAACCVKRGVNGGEHHPRPPELGAWRARARASDALSKLRVVGRARSGRFVKSRFGCLWNCEPTIVPPSPSAVKRARRAASGERRAPRDERRSEMI